MIIDENETTVAAILKTFENINIPQCGAHNDFGFCKKSQKIEFIQGLKASATFFQGT